MKESEDDPDENSTNGSDDYNDVENYREAFTDIFCTKEIREYVAERMQSNTAQHHSHILSKHQNESLVKAMNDEIISSSDSIHPLQNKFHIKKARLYIIEMTVKLMSFFFLFAFSKIFCTMVLSGNEYELTVSANISKHNDGYSFPVINEPYSSRNVYTNIILHTFESALSVGSKAPLDDNQCSKRRANGHRFTKMIIEVEQKPCLIGGRMLFCRALVIFEQIDVSEMGPVIQIKVMTYLELHLLSIQRLIAGSSQNGYIKALVQTVHNGNISKGCLSLEDSINKHHGCLMFLGMQFRDKSIDNSLDFIPNPSKTPLFRNIAVRFSCMCFLIYLSLFFMRNCCSIFLMNMAFRKRQNVAQTNKNVHGSGQNKQIHAVKRNHCTPLYMKKNMIVKFAVHFLSKNSPYIKLPRIEPTNRSKYYSTRPPQKLYKSKKQKQETYKIRDPSLLRTGSWLKKSTINRDIIKDHINDCNESDDVSGGFQETSAELTIKNITIKKKCLEVIKLKGNTDQQKNVTIDINLENEADCMLQDGEIVNEILIGKKDSISDPVDLHIYLMKLTEGQNCMVDALCLKTGILQISQDYTTVKLVCLEPTSQECYTGKKGCHKMRRGNSYIVDRPLHIAVTETIYLQIGDTNKACAFNPKYVEAVRENTDAITKIINTLESLVSPIAIGDYLMTEVKGPVSPFNFGRLYGDKPFDQTKTTPMDNSTDALLRTSKSLECSSKGSLFALQNDKHSKPRILETSFVSRNQADLECDANPVYDKYSQECSSLSNVRMTDDLEIQVNRKGSYCRGELPDGGDDDNDYRTYSQCSEMESVCPLSEPPMKASQHCLFAQKHDDIRRELDSFKNTQKQYKHIDSGTAYPYIHKAKTYSQRRGCTPYNGGYNFDEAPDCAHLIYAEYLACRKNDSKVNFIWRIESDGLLPDEIRYLKLYFENKLASLYKADTINTDELEIKSTICRLL